MWKARARQTSTWVLRGARQTRDNYFVCTVAFSFFCTESSKSYEISRLKHTQVFTMTLITTSRKQTARYVTALPSSVQEKKKKKQDHKRLQYLNKTNGTSTSELAVASWGRSWTKQMTEVFFFFVLMLWFGTDSSAIKSSNTQIITRTCPIRAKAVNQVFT